MRRRKKPTWPHIVRPGEHKPPPEGWTHWGFQPPSETITKQRVGWAVTREYVASSGLSVHRRALLGNNDGQLTDLSMVYWRDE